MNCFFDTNVFVYAVSRDLVDAKKRQSALQLIAVGDISLSMQVVQEFIHTCLRKKRLGQSAEAIASALELLFSYPCATATPETVRKALALQRRFQISYWDAAILASAEELGCHTLYSENLNHGQDYDSVKVINPFKGLPS